VICPSGYRSSGSGRGGRRSQGHVPQDNVLEDSFRVAGFPSLYGWVPMALIPVLSSPTSAPVLPDWGLFQQQRQRTASRHRAVLIPERRHQAAQQAGSLQRIIARAEVLSVIMATAFPSLGRPMNWDGWIGHGALRLSQEVRP
jgi:hypothetical protein